MRSHFFLSLGSLLFLFTAPVHSFSQDYKKDMHAMSERIVRENAFSATILASSFQNGNNAAISYEIKFKKLGDSYWHRMNDSETLITETSTILINHKSKRVIVRKTTPYEWARTKTFSYAQNVDSIVKGYDSIQFRMISQDLKSYTIYTSKKLIQKTEITYYVPASMIKKVTYYYNPKLYKSIKKSELIFIENDELKNIGKEKFTEEDIVAKNAGVYTLKEKYKNYHLKIVDTDVATKH